ncbi:MAG: PilZ domain-containing protein [Thermoanaerobaculales bacterium]|nr:PilZ domain-containing protein [Thermoanaerobaculales bacterium]
MEPSDRHVLLIDLTQEVFESLSPIFQREGFDLHSVESSAFVLDLIRGTPFELLVLGYPMKGLEIGELIEAAREPGSMCLSTGILMAVSENDLDEVMPWLDHGVNRIVTMQWPRAHIWQAVGDLLEIAPRVHIDAPIQLSLPSDVARDVVLLRTENISKSGALLTGFRTFPHGTRFDFTLVLPDAGPPITGSAEVVRRTSSEREGMDGFGMRYLVLGMGDEARLDGFIASRLSIKASEISPW